jgi:2-methylaconitate cis-trans-isomerase PrpF
MSYIQHDRNNEQMLVPITVIRGGTSRGVYFEGRNVPKPGAGLEQFVLAARGSWDAMGMDGLGGDTPLQSTVAIVSPSSRPDADVDYTFIQLTGNLFPLGNRVDTIKIDDGTTIDVTITDMVNPCAFVEAADFGIGLTGLALPNPDWSRQDRPARRSAGRAAPEGLSSEVVPSGA